MAGEGGARKMIDPATAPRVGTNVNPAAYFARVANAIKMKNDRQWANKSNNVVYEPIALLAGGCVVFVLCWLIY